jgi:hypothetical protein
MGMVFNAKRTICQPYHGENTLYFNEMTIMSDLYWINMLSWNFIVLSFSLLIDIILFHCRVTKTRRNKMMRHYQIVVPDALINNTVLTVFHDSPLGGHCGINNNLDPARGHLSHQHA